MAQALLSKVPASSSSLTASEAGSTNTATTTTPTANQTTLTPIHKITTPKALTPTTRRPMSMTSLRRNSEGRATMFRRRGKLTSILRKWPGMSLL